MTKSSDVAEKDAQKLVDWVSTVTRLDPEKDELPNADDWRRNAAKLFAQVRAEERANVVAWLKTMGLHHVDCPKPGCVRHYIADCIERGDHDTRIIVDERSDAVASARKAAIEECRDEYDNALKEQGRSEKLADLTIRFYTRIRALLEVKP